MAKKVKVDNLANEITNLLSQYNEALTDECKKVVDEVAEGVLQETKSHITWHDKKYSQAFSLKTSFEDKRNKRKTWYVKPPYYRLTHLLEFGHQTRKIRNGKARTDKYPHVSYGDKYLEDNFFSKMEEAMEKCKI